MISVEEVTLLLKELIRIPSRSYEEEKIAIYIQEYLKNCGAETWSDPHGNVFAKMGSGNPVLLLHAHMDTVPEGEGWERDPFGAEIMDNKVHGRGACDVKGGLAAMLAAFVNIAQSGQQLKGTLLFGAFVREEISPPESKGTMLALKDGLTADMAIVAEPTSLQACIAQIGRTEYKISLKGRAAHANTPEMGLNSITKMAELINELERKIQRPYSDILKRYSTFNIGTIEGGIVSNIVPPQCSILIDRGLVPGQSAEDSLNEIRDIIEDVIKNSHYSYELSVPYQGFPAEITESEPVVQHLIANINKHTHTAADPTGFVSHCDADWLITFGKIPSVIFGPGNLNVAHTNHEYVDLTEVTLATQILTDTILDILFHVTDTAN
jgi:succinyl-diaminopimelate desuccinylase